ncbi:hypothetical protein ACI2K4_09585 [Micromonospora sp. NPDC050397]|uniref:hypothetical protein n=1 Tax=Micromonospora sp. NPDC050397 TaxID=3364279 RepID=UPI00384FE687
MNDVEELLTESLHGRAAGAVDGVALLERARSRGRSYRRRRRFLAGTGLLAISAIVAVGAITGTALWPSGGNSYGQGTGVVGALPEATGEPGARAEPDRVGTDVNLVHFDAPELTRTARHYDWTSGNGYEQLEVGVGEQDLVYAAIGADMTVLDSLDRQNEVGVVVREQPVPGLWLRVQATDDKLARQVIGALDLDRVQRIVLPFQLGPLPEGARVVRASVGFVEGAYADGGVLLERARTDRMEVQAQYAPGQSGSTGRANHVAGDRQAFLYPGQDEVELLGLKNLHLSARIGKGDHQGFGVPEADLVLGAVQVATEVENISTWPETLTR